MPGDGRSGHLGADSATELREITAPGPVRSIIVDHALRGLRIQVLLRVILAAFVAAVVAFDPPAGYLTATWIVTGAYLAWSALTVVLAVRGDETTVRLLWLAAFGDLVALTAVAILASRSDAISWTSDVLLTGFAVIPMIAATQLRPWVCAVIAVPTVIVFFLASAAARPQTGSPGRRWCCTPG